MRRTFNCGIGMVAAVAAEDLDTALRRLRDSGERPFVIGEVVPATSPDRCPANRVRVSASRMRAVVLISGRGSNLQSLIDAVHAGRLALDIRAVISNEPGATGLRRAEAAGIEALVLDHRAFPNRQDFDDALAGLIDARRPDLVILAGFMRILGAAFVRRYNGRLMNIHPSLLPAFPGLDTHRRALLAGVQSCTAPPCTSSPKRWMADRSSSRPPWKSDPTTTSIRSRPACSKRSTASTRLPCSGSAKGDSGSGAARSGKTVGPCRRCRNLRVRHAGNANAADREATSAPRGALRGEWRAPSAAVRPG